MTFNFQSFLATLQELELQVYATPCCTAVLEVISRASQMLGRCLPSEPKDEKILIYLKDFTLRASSGESAYKGLSREISLPHGQASWFKAS